jgi:hypothetical protein
MNDSSNHRVRNICISVFVILVVSVIILVMIFIPKTIIHNNQKKTIGETPAHRADIGLKVYENNYFEMNQLSIPNKGIYLNTYYNQNKYYGLRDFFYASSYKSYLPCGYTDDVVSLNAIKNVILKGARVINLDLFYSGNSQFLSNSKVVVGNVINGKLSYFPGSKETDMYLDFESCLQVVRDLAWAKTDTPFFIYLNMEFLPDVKFENKTFQIIQKILSNRFLDKYYSFQRVNIGDIPVGKAMNKLILMTNRKPIDPMLNEIINGVMSETNTNVILHIMDNGSIKYGGIKTKAVNPKILTDQTTYNLVAVIKTNDINPQNYKVPKIDTKNYDTSYNFEIGVSMTFMNWQNYTPPPKSPAAPAAPAAPTISTTSLSSISNDKPIDEHNDFMYKYLLNFKNGGMVLKPDNLIYMPRPPPPVMKINPQLNYTQTSYNSFGGFQSTTI